MRNSVIKQNKEVKLIFIKQSLENINRGNLNI